MAERTISVERRGEDGRADVPFPAAGDIGRRSKTVIEKIKSRLLQAKTYSCLVDKTVSYWTKLTALILLRNSFFEENVF